MLSRAAHSVYWMSRYLERAENVARFIDVNLHLMMDRAADGGNQWAPLVNTTGDDELFMQRYGIPSKDNVMRFLTFDRDNPNSILACVWKARENARSMRDVISSEMWEQANNFYFLVKDAVTSQYALSHPHDFYTSLKMASHLFDGIADATMSRGQTWYFLRLGKMLERAEKTSRILDVKYFILLPDVKDVGGAIDSIQWAALLKSASAFEMYRKRYKQIAPEKVADFLILNREFPRAIRYCLEQAQESLRAITGSPRNFFYNEAERHLGRLGAELTYATIEEIIAQGLHEFLDTLQTQLNSIDDALFQSFFNAPEAPKEIEPSHSQ